MSVCLPTLAFLLIAAILRLRGAGRRAALVFGAVLWGAAAVLITEALSPGHWITRAGLAVAWSLIDGAALVVLILLFRRSLPPGKCPVPEDADVALWTGAGLIGLLVGIVALVSPPNTVDAMVYHMPRVIYWAENRSAGLYPSGNLLHLAMTPGAEYLMLQLQVLWGNDRLVNLVQWAGFLGSITGISLVAQLLGAGARGQTLAAAACATIPQGILTASGAKNDWVLTFWLVALAIAGLEFGRRPRAEKAACLGGALGLALLTKATAYVFAPAILAGCIPAKTIRPAFRFLPLVIVIAVVLNGPFYARNQALTGSPLAGEIRRPFEFRNGAFGPAATFSNMVRNIALHCGTPSAGWNAAVERWSEALIRLTGGDPNDPRTTWLGTRFTVQGFTAHEALAGNPVHLGLIVLCLALLAFRARRGEMRAAGVFSLGLLLAFILFCAALRWQPWHTRLHLPLFALFSAVIGAVLAARARLATAAGTLLIFLAAPVVFGNRVRPLAANGIFARSRTDMYFSDRYEHRDSFVAAAEFLWRTGCRQVGLDASLEDYEYPMLALLGAGSGGMEVWPSGIRNVSSRYSRPGPRPCAVVCLGCSGSAGKLAEYAEYEGASEAFGKVMVFSRDLPRRLADCRLNFGDGWHAREQDAGGWWRWSSGTGRLRASSSAERRIVLMAEVSSLTLPNTLEIRINGSRVSGYEFGGGPFRISIVLKPGRNEIDLVSQAAASKAPDDNRPLAFRAGNLTVADAATGEACDVF